MTDDTAESLGLKKAKGALIASVVSGDPAEKGGIQAGDVILKFDGKDIDDETKLSRVVANTDIGKDVDVVVWRNGKEKRLTVNLVQRKDEDLIAQNDKSKSAPEDAAEQEVAGMELGALTQDARSQYNIPDDVEGVLVTKVERNSDAAKKGIRPGMVIVQVGQEGDKKSTLSPVSLVAKITDLKEKSQKFVLLRVFVQDRYLWVPVQINEG